MESGEGSRTSGFRGRPSACDPPTTSKLAGKQMGGLRKNIEFWGAGMECQARLRSFCLSGEDKYKFRGHMLPCRHHLRPPTPTVFSKPVSDLVPAMPLPRIAVMPQSMSISEKDYSSWRVVYMYNKSDGHRHRFCHHPPLHCSPLFSELFEFCFLLIGSFIFLCCAGGAPAALKCPHWIGGKT